jgi:SAM-dependent methyltransferase
MIKEWQLRKFSRSNRNVDPNLSTQLIVKDVYLKTVYEGILNRQKKLSNEGTRIEFGSAGGITKILDNSIITSDVRMAAGVDRVIDASGDFRLEHNSIDAFLSKDVLHHLPNVHIHFNEIEQTLINGGVSSYVEPNWNMFSKFIYTFIHPEPFITKQKEWVFDSEDPMFSNQALPYICFVRDSNKFKKLYPNLLVTIEPVPLDGLAYVLSGGVFNRTLIPSKYLLRLRNFELDNRWFLKIFGLNRLIIIKKIS